MKPKNLSKSNEKLRKKYRKEYAKIGFKLPIKSIHNLITGEDKSYKLLSKVTPINAELESDVNLEKISDAIKSALSSFNGRYGIYIQSEKIDISRNIVNIEKEKNKISDYVNENQKSGNINIALSLEKKLELLEKQLSHLKSLTSKSMSVLVFYMVLETYEKSYINAEQVLNDSFSSIKSELETVNIFITRLFEDDIKEMLYKKMNPISSFDQRYQKNWFIENLYPETAARPKNGRVIEIEEKIYRFYSITGLPSTVDKYRWLRKLLQFKGDINIAIIMNPKKKEKMIKKLSKNMEISEVKSLTNRNEALRQKYTANIESIKNIIRDISRDNIDLYDVNITIGIGASSLEELDTLNSMLRAKISSMFMQITAIVRKEFTPFYTILPILDNNFITNNLVWNLTTDDIATIIPFDSSEFMEDTGVLIGENSISGGLVIADFRNKIYNNSHMAIIADSGAGKTFYIKLDAIRNMPYIDYTIMFDVKGDLYFPWGKRVSFSATSGTVINPFHIRSTIVDSETFNENGINDVGTFLSQKIMDLIVFFNWIIPNMSAFDESILEQDIRDAYKKSCLDFESTSLPKEFCTIGTLDEVMNSKLEQNISGYEKERREFLKACLNPYIHGSYSKIFNGQTNWEFDYFTVLNISNIPEAIKKPIYDILLKDVWQFAKKDGIKNPTKKDIYIDEAHEFADTENPQTFEFLSKKLVKQGRSFGVRTITATQNISDFLSLPKWGQSILDNSYFKLFMKLGENDILTATKLYSFSGTEKKILQGKSGIGGRSTKGKGIFTVATQKVLVQIIPSKFELEIIDPILYKDIYNEDSKYYKIKDSDLNG
ncbi:MAG: hypothetical protein ABF289_13225 [Clostridiales bacterium]